jgi:hypothetical protein
MIEDVEIRHFFQNCIAYLPEEERKKKNKTKQFFRGVTARQWRDNKYPGICCRRHMLVFKTYGVIPEYCFNCYKIAIEPRNVIELFKLMIVMEAIKLSNDNTRKCMVETRPDITGTYKGYVYFQDLNEAKELLPIINELVSENISNNINVSIKRGCSEYPLKYPEYANIENEGKQFTYKEEWREYEEYADKNLIQDLVENRMDSYNPVNSSGFTLKDISVMYSWLEYAKTIGDKSYLKITDLPIPTIPGLKRPAFKSNPQRPVKE